MKKIYFLVATMLFSIFSLLAQDAFRFKIIDGPKLLPDEARVLPVGGVSAEGTYVWGTFSSVSFILNTKTGEVINEGNDTDNTTQVKQVLDNGTTLLFKKDNGLVRFIDGTEKVLVSPISDTPYANPRQITRDSKIIVGNLENDVFEQVPFIAHQQGDGSYKVKTIQYPTEDPSGARAGYTQAFFPSEDGKYIIGRQVNNLGTGWSIIVWTRQDDGSYTYTTPLDKYFYNLEEEKPGPSPEWEEYVTSDDYDSEEYKEQEAAFDKAYAEWEKKMKKFSKTEQLNLIWMSMDPVEPIIYSEVLIDIDKSYPVVFNYETNEFLEFKASKGWKLTTHFADGGYLAVRGEAPSFETGVMNADGSNVQEFESWVREKSGTDVSTFYQHKVGYPAVSANGKTIVSYYVDQTSSDPLYLNTILVADKSLLYGEAGATPILKEEILKITFDGKEITAPAQTLLSIFTLDGTLLTQGKVPSTGKWLLTTSFPKGSYIVKAQLDGSTTSIKIVK